jgi:TnpA family transposase
MSWCATSQACNFGITPMAEASGLTDDTLAWTMQWYLRKETLRPAGAAIVNYHHRLPMAQAWGGGTMSSSDGQRFPMKGKSLTARALSRYVVDEARACTRCEGTCSSPNEGAVRRRHLDQQTDQALCLSLLVNAIITCYLGFLRYGP